MPNSGLIFLPPTLFTSVHRETMVTLVARHRVPATYPIRSFSTAGGLMSYGVEYQAIASAGGVLRRRTFRGHAPSQYVTVVVLGSASCTRQEEYVYVWTLGVEGSAMARTNSSPWK